ncbi:uncharacterized protein LOC116845237 isoform X3 [Odontomachus brunneus]|uniref:uncharacterized protein LOC116845237 isoform X3 n=1 Tax=Odontomachus brunneus TaxID=486640 RepID=UPI0013F1FA2C|nr:uncharacterized protein LOC116845237 isoform X3 [Odontomachus brunneus]
MEIRVVLLLLIFSGSVFGKVAWNKKYDDNYSENPNEIKWKESSDPDEVYKREKQNAEDLNDHENIKNYDDNNYRKNSNEIKWKESSENDIHLYHDIIRDDNNHKNKKNSKEMEKCSKCSNDSGSSIIFNKPGKIVKVYTSIYQKIFWIIMKKICFFISIPYKIKKWIFCLWVKIIVKYISSIKFIYCKYLSIIKKIFCWITKIPFILKMGSHKIV